jgi:hypothetical protein
MPLLKKKLINNNETYKSIYKFHICCDNACCDDILKRLHVLYGNNLVAQFDMVL